jgi:hypothetical protein
LRRALREAKMLLETGEVVDPGSPPAKYRSLMSLPINIVPHRDWKEAGHESFYLIGSRYFAPPILGAPYSSTSWQIAAPHHRQFFLI